ncbi:sigma-E factor regulatory protein RseB domain-containing protein, partial [Motilibacter deserti]
ARALASEDVAYTAYAESVGRLPLPDAGPLDDLADLLGDRSRIRVWWRSPQEHRVDVLSAAGERDTYATTVGTAQWDSDELRLRLLLGDGSGVRAPTPQDLLPAELGRRLLGGAAPGQVRRDGTERVAGRDAVTLVVEPADERTLVRRVDVAVDADTGLPLRVAVTARGGARPTLESAVLDLELRAPADEDLALPFGPDTRVERVSALSARRLAEQVAPYLLPGTLAGLPRRSEAVGGAGSYGTGYALLAVVPLPAYAVAELDRRLRGPGVTELDEDYGEGLRLGLPLLSALTLRAGDRAYLLVGTVPPGLLERAARELAASPPPFDPSGYTEGPR